MTIRPKNRRTVLIHLLLGVGLLIVGGPAERGWADEPIAEPEPEPKPKLADYFGFLPLELYKLDYRIGNLTVADFDGDGTADVLVANNARSRLDLLLSSKRPEGEAESRPFRADVNELESDKRMRLVNIPVNKEVVSLGVGDFNGDGKPDIVYYGTPAEVEILHNEGGGKFAEPKRIDSGEALESSRALAVGDLDQDGRDDIALISEGELILIYQPSPGKLSEPERIPHTASNPLMVKIQDLDGDGDDDLVILDGGTDHPIHVRFGSAEKKLGPERRFAIEPPRAIAFGQIDGKPGAEILTIESQSGRGKVYKFEASADDPEQKWGRLIFFGLPKGSERGRALAVGDLDGDQKKDVVVTEPANAQVWVHRQTGKHGLSAGESYPSLLGAKEAALADLDGDGRDELYVLSEQEKQIGRSRFEDGRLGFPTPLPIKGEPVSMGLAELEPSKPPAIVYASRTTPGGDKFELRAIRLGESGQFEEVKFGQAETVAVTGLSGAPTAIRAFDVNHDGRVDLILFSAFGSPILFLGGDDGSLKPFTEGLGPLGGATASGLSRMDLNGPALIVAQNTFARHVALDSKGQWEVKDQYNASRGSAQIQGAAALDATGDGETDIVLLDKSTKSLLFLTPREGVYRQSGSLSLGSINFEGLSVGDFNGDGRDDLLIAGSDRFAILETGGEGGGLEVIGGYEPSRKDARLGDLIAGDLNGDGVADVVFTDVAEQSFDVAVFAGEGEELLHALTFKVFERKSFRGGGDLIEPREMAVGDVDGDGRDDLVLILHDRVVILRQDPGPDQSAAKETAAK